MGNWATSGYMNKTRYYHGLAGTTSAAIAMASGAAGNKNTSETFNGATWTNAGDLNGGDLERTNGAGTQVAALVAAGVTQLTRAETFNGRPTRFQPKWDAIGGVNRRR